MRYKYRPEDFVVRERLREGILQPEGKFQVFLLEKKGKETFEVLERLQRWWKIPSRSLGIAGIKDKYGHTFQYISVPRTIKKLPSHDGFRLEFVGYSEKPIDSGCLAANDFSLVIREVSFEEKNKVMKRLESLQSLGMPNYFDDQRFGSYEERRWVGKLLFLGQMEEVLRSFMRTHAPEGIRKDLLSSWGKWKVCLDLCEGKRWRVGVRVFSFLAQEGHEKGFRHAVGLLDHRYLLLVANAYLSFLFNRSLSLRLQGGEGIFLPMKGGEVFFPGERKTIPTEGWVVAYDVPEVDGFTEEVLREEGISLSDLKIRGIYGATLHAKRRSLWVYPEVKDYEWREDEFFPGFWKFSLSLSLPPGSYATLVLKYLCF
ncbi:tRNA pseudouridine(13) synthase [Brevinematales bacterium NS]|nr:tRNA pseudouridine(13) synthase [Brevinematales bacterium NS]